jgi:hypothetical protein
MNIDKYLWTLKWTRELEDDLFWPISMFCTAGCERVHEETLKKIQSALGLRHNE